MPFVVTICMSLCLYALFVIHFRSRITVIKNLQVLKRSIIHNNFNNNSMDKILKPNRLDVDPSDANAGKEWTHWIRTFDNFLNSIPPTDEGGPPLNKLPLLVNFVSPRVYQYIEDCTSYSEAIEILKQSYVKPTNEIYARHLLATRRQKSGESLDEYFQSLKKLSKDCNFRQVTAGQYRDEYIRDAFITGLLSSSIRQRLLENKSLHLDEMFTQARTLEAAHTSSQSFLTQNSSSLDSSVAAVGESKTENVLSLDQSLVAGMSSFKLQKCYFCGYTKHSRDKCPAKDQLCNKCSKKGHFARVCRGNPRATNAPTAAIREYEESLSSLSTYSSPTLATVVGSCNEMKSTAIVKIGDVDVTALVDSGSQESFIHPDVVKRAALTVNCSTKKVSMATSSLTVATEGICIIDFEMNGHKYTHVKLSILPNLCADLILGHDFQSLHESVILKYGGSLSPLTICSLTAIEIEPPKLFANLTADCSPIATKSRNYSESDREFIRGKCKNCCLRGSLSPPILLGVLKL